MQVKVITYNDIHLSIDHMYLNVDVFFKSECPLHFLYWKSISVFNSKLFSFKCLCAIFGLPHTFICVLQEQFTPLKRPHTLFYWVELYSFLYTLEGTYCIVYTHGCGLKLPPVKVSPFLIVHYYFRVKECIMYLKLQMLVLFDFIQTTVFRKICQQEIFMQCFLLCRGKIACTSLF